MTLLYPIVSITQTRAPTRRSDIIRKAVGGSMHQAVFYAYDRTQKKLLIRRGRDTQHWGNDDREREA